MPCENNRWSVWRLSGEIRSMSGLCALTTAFQLLHGPNPEGGNWDDGWRTTSWTSTHAQCLGPSLLMVGDDHQHWKVLDHLSWSSAWTPHCKAKCWRIWSPLFSYLGSEFGQTAKVKREVAVRLEKASKVYEIWRQKVFRNRNLSRPTNVHMFRTVVMSVLLYGAETWPVT